MKKFCYMILASLLITSTTFAQIWDETIDGGGDAGTFPVGTSYQFSPTPGTWDVITGALGPGANDVDAFCIRITDATIFNATTFQSPLPGGSETDTRLWLFTLSGSLVMANDDTSRPTGDFLAEIGNVGSFWTGNTNSPGSVVTGQDYILAVSGFSVNYLDTASNPMVTFTPFTTLHGLNPASNGIAGSFTGTNGTQGTYRIGLTGAVLTAIPEPSVFTLGLIGCTLGLATIRRKA